MGAQENLQVKDVTLVSFLTCLQINGFKYLWKWPHVANNILTTFCQGVFVDGTKCFVEEMS